MGVGNLLESAPWVGGLDTPPKFFHREVLAKGGRGGWGQGPGTLRAGFSPKEVSLGPGQWRGRCRMWGSYAPQNHTCSVHVCGRERFLKNLIARWRGPAKSYGGVPHQDPKAGPAPTPWAGNGLTQVAQRGCPPASPGGTRCRPPGCLAVAAPRPLCLRGFWPQSSSLTGVRGPGRTHKGRLLLAAPCCWRSQGPTHVLGAGTSPSFRSSCRLLQGAFRMAHHYPGPGVGTISLSGSWSARPRFRPHSDPPS